MHIFLSPCSQYVESPSFNRRSLDPVSVLHQTMSGLAHLHSLNIGKRAASLASVHVRGLCVLSPAKPAALQHSDQSLLGAAGRAGGVLQPCSSQQHLRHQPCGTGPRLRVMLRTVSCSSS